MIIEDLLHVYGQNSWHDDVCVLGSRKALTNLRNAIDRVLATNEPKLSEGMVSDGEGFCVLVGVVEDEEIESKLAVPYIDEIAREQNEKAMRPEEAIGIDKYRQLIEGARNESQ